MYKYITATTIGIWDSVKEKASFAVWIRGDFGLYKESGLLKLKREDEANDNTRTILANVAAIGNTLHIVEDLLKNNGQYFTKLIVNNYNHEAHAYITKNIDTGAIVATSAASLINRMVNKQKAQNPNNRIIQPQIELRAITEAELLNNDNLCYAHNWVIKSANKEIKNQ